MYFIQGVLLEFARVSSLHLAQAPPVPGGGLRYYEPGPRGPRRARLFGKVPPAGAQLWLSFSRKGTEKMMLAPPQLVSVV